MKNTCIMCGDEVQEGQHLCGVCNAVYENLPPDRQKNLKKVIENEEARTRLRAALADVKLQFVAALGPVCNAIVYFIDTVLQMTEGGCDE